MRFTRLGMQAGPAGKTDQLGRKEISSAITMISLVVIYSLVDAPVAVTWALQGVLSYLEPNNSWNDSLLVVGGFMQVRQQNVTVSLPLHSRSRRLYSYS